MKLKTYLENLQKAVIDDPSLLDLDVVCSKDDEGNAFNRVFHEPTSGYYDGEYNGDFVSEEQFEEYQIDPSDRNAVCIN